MNNECNHHVRCIEKAINNAKELCLKLNVKFTPLRQNVLSLIWESHVPLKAYDILKKLQIIDDSAKPMTVYRILDFFVEHKIVHKIESQNRFLGCSHPGENHHCGFLICTECNVVEEICQKSFFNNLENHLAKKDFLGMHIILEILGICNNCGLSARAV